MSYEELLARIDEYERNQIDYRISIICFGKDEESHLYAITAIYN